MHAVSETALAILFPDKIAAAPLVPWYAWALVPLTLANVLIQNLLARGRFAAMPWLIRSRFYTCWS